MEPTSDVAPVASFGSDCFAGAPTFVPRAGGVEEDDGYVLMYVYDARRHGSDLVILDAASFELVAKVRLPTRVPPLFHGSWTEEVWT